jgi:hypothetical protein
MNSGGLGIGLVDVHDESVGDMGTPPGRVVGVAMSEESARHVVFPLPTLTSGRVREYSTETPRSASVSTVGPIRFITDAELAPPDCVVGRSDGRIGTYSGTSDVAKWPSRGALNGPQSQLSCGLRAMGTAGFEPATSTSSRTERTRSAYTDNCISRGEKRRLRRQSRRYRPTKPKVTGSNPALSAPTP